jgi:hypothetical protein
MTVAYEINIQKSVAFLYTNDDLKNKPMNHPIYDNSKNNKILRNKFNSRGERFIYQKL